MSLFGIEKLDFDSGLKITTGVSVFIFAILALVLLFSLWRVDKNKSYDEEKNKKVITDAKNSSTGFGVMLIIIIVLLGIMYGKKIFNL